MTSSANTSSAPVICAVSATAAPSSTRNATDSARTGTPRAAATSGSTEANSSGRPITASTASTASPATASSDHLACGDAEETAEEQGGGPVEEPLVEGDEQQPAGQGEGLHRAGQRRLGGQAAR